MFKEGCMTKHRLFIGIVALFLVFGRSFAGELPERLVVGAAEHLDAQGVGPFEYGFEVVDGGGAMFGLGAYGIVLLIWYYRAGGTT